MPEGAPLLEARALSKVYRPAGAGGPEVRALDGIDLRIDAGEYLAIVGPSGSGKSTLMQILGLLDRPSSGTLYLAGHEVSRLSDDQLAILRNRNIGFIFQFFNLLARTSALNNVALPLIYGRQGQVEGKARGLLKKVGMEERLHHAPHQLSGGQQQRVAIARALANDPPLLFADEPTGNISSAQAEEVMQQLDTMNSQGVTVILVTHEPEIAAHAKRVIHVRDGRVVSDERTPRRKRPAPGGVKTKAFEIPRVSALPSPAALKENVRMAVTALSLNKVRTFLTMLGVIIGVTGVITITAISNGAKAAVKQRLSSLGSNLLMVRPQNQNAFGSGSAPRFTPQDEDALKQLVGHGTAVRAVEGTVQGNVVVNYGDQNWQTQVTGCEPVYEQMHAAQPISGRFFTREEDESRARVCLLGATVIKNLYPPGFDPTGTTVQINKQDFQVIGVLPVKGGGGFRDQDDVVVIPLQTAMYRVLGTNTISSFDVEASETDKVDECMNEVSEMLRHTRHIRPGQDDDFMVRNMADIQSALQDSANILSNLMLGAAALALVVGGIGIMNIMLVSVRERTKEIGLRKALGARNLEVMFQFLVEAVTIGLIGGVFGILGGDALAVLASWLLGQTVLFTWAVVLVAVLVSAVVGVSAGLWPAWQASKLSPIEALRYE